MKIYKELQAAFEHFNRTLFNGEAEPCLITLQRKANTMGYISYNRFSKMDNSEYLHELALNPEYFGVTPVIEIFQTMVHEMCHLIIFLRGLDTRKTYHNQHWANLMDSVGLTPSHTGRLGGNKTGQKMADYPEPNGLFVIACNDLLQSGVIIEWYDRFYPAKTTEQSVKNNHYFIYSLLDDGNTHQDLIKIPVIENGQISLITGKDNQTNTFTNSSIEVGTGTSGLSVPTTKGKGSKIKYSCNCGYNIWGKSGLNVQCMECLEQYTEKG